jgi:CheY-like chemotaxis protein
VADETTVRIEVADRGAGIAPDSLERIFEMFSQGETQDARTQTGLGVGLALARQLTLMHEGTIDASSEGPGRGARFTLTMPRAPSPPVAEIPATERPAALHDAWEATPARVLLVDDNVDFASSLAQLFGVGGHDVRVAHDGTSALDIAREFKPEVCFLDIGLPDMSGHDLARRLRAAADNPTPILIAISGWGMDEDRRRSLDAGFSLHLVKPVDYRTVRDAMRELRRKGAA